MSRVLSLLPSWRGRALYLPPLMRELRLARVPAGIALLWWVLVGWHTPWAFLVPAAALFFGPVVYIRSWRVWDLLVWDSELPWRTPPAEQDANYDAAAVAYVAVMSRRPEAVRAALATIDGSTQWRRTVDLYYAALADLMDGREPNSASLSAQLDLLDRGPRHDSAEVMVALVAAGAANLAGSDWRSPLQECRKRLHLRLSLRRVLWPMQFALVPMVVGQLVIAVCLNLIGW